MGGWVPPSLLLLLQSYLSRILSRARASRSPRAAPGVPDRAGGEAAAGPAAAPDRGGPLAKGGAEDGDQGPGSADGASAAHGKALREEGRKEGGASAAKPGGGRVAAGRSMRRMPRLHAGVVRGTSEVALQAAQFASHPLGLCRGEVGRGRWCWRAGAGSPRSPPPLPTVSVTSGRLGGRQQACWHRGWRLSAGQPCQAVAGRPEWPPGWGGGGKEGCRRCPRLPWRMLGSRSSRSHAAGRRGNASAARRPVACCESCPFLSCAQGPRGCTLRGSGCLFQKVPFPHRLLLQGLLVRTPPPMYPMDWDVLPLIDTEVGCWVLPPLHTFRLVVFLSATHAHPLTHAPPPLSLSHTHLAHSHALNNALSTHF